MKKIYTLLFVIFLSLFYQCAKAEQNATKIYNMTVDSVLYVETQKGSGSGVIVKEDGTFVTCFHVIADADYIIAKTNQGKDIKINGYRYLDPENDIAILTLATTKKYKPILINDKELLVGEPVYALANPKGLQFVFSDGMINRLTKDKIQFSAPSSSGSSGGALINSDGKLIGIISEQYDPSLTQNINFAISNKLFAPYLEHKKKINSKKMIWTDFVVSKSTEKQLKSYVSYASNQGDTAMLYRYIKPIKNNEEVTEDDYAYWGTIAIISYITSGANDKSLLDESIKWYSRSLNSSKNMELSSYAIVLTCILKSDYENIETYLSYLKKYPRSYKVMKKINKKLNSCKSKACYTEAWNTMENHLKKLSDITFSKNNTEGNTNE